MPVPLSEPDLRSRKSGTGHKPNCYPGDLLSRIQPAFLQIRPLLIGLEKLVAERPFKDQKNKTAWRLPCPHETNRCEQSHGCRRKRRFPTMRACLGCRNK